MITLKRPRNRTARRVTVPQRDPNANTALQLGAVEPYTIATYRVWVTVLSVCPPQDASGEAVAMLISLLCLSGAFCPAISPLKLLRHLANHKQATEKD
jgi:hypothetical protein